MIKGNWVRAVKRGNEGFTLIEVLIALAIFGFMGIVVLSGLGTSLLSNQINREKITADYLAKSQLEYVKSQEYINDLPITNYKRITEPPISKDITGYSVNMTALKYNPLNPLEVVTVDTGIQKITVYVYKSSPEKLLLSITEFKLK